MWKDKLKSRKLWAVVAVGLLVAANSLFNLGIDQGTIDAVTQFLKGGE